MKRWLLSLPFLASLCACDQGWETSIDIDPFSERADAAIEGIGATAQALHWIEGDWAKPDENGIAVPAEGAVLVAQLPELPARLVVETVADPGQRLRVQLNGVFVGEVDCGTTAVLKLNASLFHAELDRLELLPTSAEHRSHAADPPALLLRRLRVDMRGELPMAQPADGWWSAENWEPKPIVPRAVVGARPDLLVIVLDAARADHLSCYGYARKTTPSIDKLADGGITLSHVYAEASFTHASMPTFLSGASWFRHGAALQGDRLPQELPTIPELLQRHGYQTLALSENPHVAVSTGLDRGFDVFWESWKQPGIGGDRWNQLPGLFGRLLDEALDERPMFALVHALPPHVPYVPTPLHDLWREDDETASWTTVSGEELRRISRGERTLSPPETKRLIALYDGNLHRADAQIAAMIQMWQTRRPDHPLRVLITSDHGEAFGEHGRHGHSFTLHDEMTHIPAVFWPREAFETLAEERAQLRSNADLLPLLLHSIGFSKPTRRSVVPMRSLRAVGARSLEELLLFDRYGGPQEFDLSQDPRATNNIWKPASTDWLNGLGGLLQTTLPQRSAVAVETPAEDLERLKSLGYVD